MSRSLRTSNARSGTQEKAEGLSNSQPTAKDLLLIQCLYMYMYFSDFGINAPESSWIGRSGHTLE